MFSLDIALDLIKQCPSLALALDKEGSSPLYALSASPNTFPSVDGLVFWKRWIYNYCEYQSLFLLLLLICTHISDPATHYMIKPNFQGIE
jgi:hypothetical protein